MGVLERRYRLLLKAYPRDYRARRGDEIIATYLDSARPGQLIPSLADTVDILGHALRRRFSPDLEEAACLASPWALALIAGVAGFVGWRVEPPIWIIMSLLGLGCTALTRPAALDTESRLNIAAASALSCRAP